MEIPAVSLGTEINLINGVAGQKHLADEPAYSKLLEQQVLILPVVLGGPAMNQSRPVVGFIGVQVVSVETDSSGGVVETINCRLVKTIARGSDSGGQSTGNATYDAALQDLSPVSVRLMSNTATEAAQTGSLY